MTTPSVDYPGCPGVHRRCSSGSEVGQRRPVVGRRWRPPTMRPSAWRCDSAGWRRRGFRRPTVRCPCMRPGGCRGGSTAGAGGNSCVDLGGTAMSLRGRRIVRRFDADFTDKTNVFRV